VSSPLTHGEPVKRLFPGAPDFPRFSRRRGNGGLPAKSKVSFSPGGNYIITLESAAAREIPKTPHDTATHDDMIIGIGIDIVRIERIRAAVERHGDRFVRRVFTAGEREHCMEKKRRYESLAARFAVKEAAFKALGRGWDECGGFTSVEVLNDDGGRPRVVFHRGAKAFAESLSVKNILVSLAHESDTAAAVVVLER